MLVLIHAGFVPLSYNAIFTFPILLDAGVYLWYCSFLRSLFMKGCGEMNNSLV